jgi:hypothetical protein
LLAGLQWALPHHMSPWKRPACQPCQRHGVHQRHARN